VLNFWSHWQPVSLNFEPCSDDDNDDSDDDDSGGGVGEDVTEGNNDDNSEEVQISDILCTTNSGRTCRTWKGRYLYY